MKALSFEIYHPDLIKWLIFRSFQFGLDLKQLGNYMETVIDCEQISFELFDL